MRFEIVDHDGQKLERRGGKPKFCVVERKVLIEDAGLVTSYGIQAQDRREEMHFEVYDISPNRSKVEHIQAILEEGDVSPVHLRDVLDNLLVTMGAE